MARSSGPVPGMVGRGVARVYAAEVARRNRAFDAGRGVERIEMPVISVGNLSVGGTGKTPMVAWIVDRLRAMGRRPAIAMRGYGPKHAGRSDEEAEYAARVPGVPIIAQPDRLAGLRALRAVAPDTFDCVVLDDGFQHRRMARDLDIVLMDAMRDVFADRCLPAGWLREPVASLARADAIIATRADMVPQGAVRAMLERARAIAPRAVLASCAHEWVRLIVVEPDGRAHEESSEWIRGKRIVGACGIANPGAFFSQLSRQGASIPATITLADHAPWTSAQMARVGAESRRAGVHAVAITEKDWVKLEGRTGAWGVPVVRPRVAMGFRSGEAEVVALLARAIGPRSGDTISP